MTNFQSFMLTAAIVFNGAVVGENLSAALMSVSLGGLAVLSFLNKS